MKKVKMGLMAFAALTGIGSALAFSPKTTKNLTTYYALKSGSSFVWVTSPPAHKSCSNTAINVTCTITTANLPVDGQMPAGQPITNQVYQ